ncbi:MAG: energy transducer TonB [Alistipes sp.]|nr:energy transducer TonB [Alistipes sp.]
MYIAAEECAARGRGRVWKLLRLLTVAVAVAASSMSVWGQAERAPLYIVNGERMSEEQVKDIDPSDIVSNTLLPADEQTIAEYGPEANNGVVVIVLRYDTPPRFEVDGEQTGYSRYVAGMVEWNAESDPVARVIIAFRVEADGSVTVRDILEATDKRLCRRVLKAIESAPRWQPALKDGEGVATDHVLRITLPEGRTLPRERVIAI